MSIDLIYRVTHQVSNTQFFQFDFVASQCQTKANLAEWDADNINSQNQIKEQYI